MFVFPLASHTLSSQGTLVRHSSAGHSPLLTPLLHPYFRAGAWCHRAQSSSSLPSRFTPADCHRHINTLSTRTRFLSSAPIPFPTMARALSLMTYPECPWTSAGNLSLRKHPCICSGPPVSQEALPSINSNLTHWVMLDQFLPTTSACLRKLHCLTLEPIGT